MAARELTPFELRSLQLFADANGRKWKFRLLTRHWLTCTTWEVLGNPCATGGALNQLHQSHGRDWLDAFRFPAEG